jgi:hypothetical protein
MPKHSQRDQHTRRREFLGHESLARLPANLSPQLRTLFRQYENQAGGSRESRLRRTGIRVAVLIKVAFPPAFGAFLPRLKADGLHVTRSLPAEGMAEGTLPITELRAVARIAASVKLAPRPNSR